MPLEKTYVWLTFDLGVQGDYDGLYAWLDKNKAKECGATMAFFQFEYSSDPQRELQAELAAAMTTTAKTRIYAIHDNPKKPGKPIGHFIFGGRKASPWAGFAPQAPGKPDVT